MANLPPLHWPQPQTRIVQYQGRRFALRLERIFWQQLESLAERRGLRLGQLVAELDAGYDGVNLSSYIRGFCMAEANRDLARYRLNAGAFDLLGVVRGCPSPALILDHDRLIVEANQPLIDWLGPPPPIWRMAKFDDLFTPRVVRPLDETFQLMQERLLQRTQIQSTYQGRAVTMTLTALPVGAYFYCLVWLHVSSALLRPF